MDLSSLPIFQMLQKKMTWLTDRQKVVSENLANADTPGYRTQTLEEPDFSAYLSGSGGKVNVATTNAQHLGAGPAAGNGPPADTVPAENTQVSPDGNSVNLTQESMKMAETQIQYNMATNLYRKHVSMLRMALGRQN